MRGKPLEPERLILLWGYLGTDTDGRIARKCHTSLGRVWCLRRRCRIPRFQAERLNQIRQALRKDKARGRFCRAARRFGVSRQAIHGLWKRYQWE